MDWELNFYLFKFYPDSRNTIKSLLLDPLKPPRPLRRTHNTNILYISLEFVIRINRLSHFSNRFPLIGLRTTIKSQGLTKWSHTVNIHMYFCWNKMSITKTKRPNRTKMIRKWITIKSNKKILKSVNICNNNTNSYDNKY